MNGISAERIKKIRSFPSLVKFLRDELGWHLDADDIDDLTFEYEPDELGIDPKLAVKIREIKQLRPFAENQPWGIFYISFEPKRLPVVVLRRVLRALVIRRRESANPSGRPVWKLHDLLFISAYGEEDTRAITFVHFKEDESGNLPTLSVIGWDAQDTPLHIDHCIQELGRLKFDPALSPDAWREQWASAFALKHREAITTSKALAAKLAELAGRIRTRVNAVLRAESKNGPMRKLFTACQDTLVHDLNEDRFADMFAQTVAYGLFSARCSRTSGALVADNLTDMIPETNLFLRELLSAFFSVGGKKGKIDFDELGINDVAEMLRDAEMEAVLRDFDDRNPQEDPVIHFYEDFLRQYDARQKIQRGAFYTPRPAVSFIVRSVHELLKKDFGLKDGLADTATWGDMLRQHKDIKIPEHISEDAPFVQMLDPAAGTGTFLVEIIDLIYKTLAEKWEREGKDIKTCWNDYVPEHLLPRLYGFELMMAPYAIAHMKIALKLIETGYEFKMRADEAIRIYLTSSLEPARETFPDYLEEFSPALAHEAYTANEVKRNMAITAVIGNPPYAVSSSNRTEFITRLMDKYKNAVKNERNIQPLSDDYIKFIRFKHLQIEKTKQGVSGIITNNSFIDGLIHRGMREELLKTFENIYILNLHGNANKRDSCPDGSKDENVFDIKQGVCISFFIKTGNKKGTVYYQNLQGAREKKYNFLYDNRLTEMKWENVDAAKPDFWFVKKDLGFHEDYKSGFILTEIFSEYNSGVKTHNDGELVYFEAACIKNEKEYCYRPFDIRLINYDLKKVLRHRFSLMKHLLKKNKALVSTRQYIENIGFNHCFLTNLITDIRITTSNRGSGFVFPLYLYPDNEELQIEKTSNFTKAFSEAVRSFYIFQPKPEQILAYIYAVLHSPTYRQRYAEFLKIDFPRIPFTRSKDLFEALSSLGGELVSLHLLESEKLDEFITAFPVPGDNAVTKVGETGKKLKNLKDGKGRLYINKTQYFDGIPETVWNFYIGGYQVCHKWLYDRKKAGRRLSDDDIRHYHKIVVALNETLRIMQEIDEVIEGHGGFPIQ